MRLLRIFIACLAFSVLTALCPPARAKTIVPPAERISDDQARRALADLYWWAKNPRQAAALYGRLLQKNPKDLNLILGLMRAQLALGHHDQVSAAAARLAARDITDRRILTELAWLEADLGHVVQSKKYFQQAIKLTTQRQTLSLDMAEAMNLWGDFYRIEAIYRGYLAKHPADQAVNLKLARMLMSAQRFEESEGLYLKLLKMDSADQKAARGLLELKWEERDLTGCLKQARVILHKWPDEPMALDMQGRVFLRQGKFAKAYESFSRLASLGGHQPEGLTGTGRALLGLKEPKKAEELFQQALSAAPHDPAARFYSAGKDKAASQEFVDKLLKQNSHRPPELLAWARLYADNGLLPQAISCLRAAQAQDPDYFPARLALAEDLAIDQQYKEANKLLAGLARDLPGVSKVLITQARVLAWSRHYQDAVKLYLKIHRLNPKDPVPLKEAARAAAWGKDMHQAWNLYEKLLEPPVARQLAQALKSSAHAPLPPDLAHMANDIKEDPRGEDVFKPYEKLRRELEQKKIPAWQKKRLAALLLDLRPAYRIQKAAYLEALAKLAQWDKRHTLALTANAKLAAFQPGNQEALFDLAQTQCALGLCGQEGRTYHRLLQLDPRNSRAALALKRQGIRQKPRVSTSYSRWQEDGRGEAARITRHRADLALDLPVLCRFNLKVSGHQWWELPKRWGGEARARGFSLEAAGPLTPYVSGGLGWTHKDYQEDYLADKDSGFGHLWFRLMDYLRLGVGWQREDVIKNAFSLVQGVQADVWWLGAAADLTRRLETKAYARHLDFNDGNKGNWESLSLGYALTDHPRILKLTMNLDYRDTENQTVEFYTGNQLTAMTHPYWTPQDWLGGTLVVEWYHDVSQLFFCGAELNYYDLRLSMGTDTENNPSVGLEALWHSEFADYWNFEIKGLLHRSRKWDASGLWINLGYRI